jgi:hypothetical protein
MLRVFIALNIFFFTLYSCEGGYDFCAKKVKDSNSILNKTIQIPISESTRLVFSRTTPKQKILKYDPFLSLYIVKDKHGFKYPFKINMRYPSGLAAVTNNTTKEGKITSNQIGLNKFASFSCKIKSPAILTNSCCSLEGIVTPKGIIQKAYIKRFITNKDVRYGDIGIRVKDTKHGIKVVSFDPFMKNNLFLKDDYILSIDGKIVKYSSSLMQKILFSKIGSIHNLKVKRKNKILNIEVKTKKRISGGYKTETYLENYGITFDKSLYITKIDKNKNRYGLNIGDKLLQVNTHSVKTQKDVMKYISDFKDNPNLLFERNHFQFFIKID